MSPIFDWARPENVQPEPISVDIWRELPPIRIQLDWNRLSDLVL